LTSVVYYTPFESKGDPDNLNQRIAGLLETSGFTGSLKAGDSVAVKIHPGEKNNVTYVRPTFVRSVAGLVAGTGARPFVTETTTLYCRERYTAGELTATAAGNGFSRETMGCPFVVADTVPDRLVTVKGRYLTEVGVAGAIAEADAMVVLSHVTGHSWTAGLAGAIKQLGMGCAGRATKAAVHMATTLTIDEELCISCGECAETCKGDAIDLSGDFAVFKESCVRCGVCIGSCEQHAIGYSHDYVRFGQALAEAAAGGAGCFAPGRVAYVNFLVDLTWHCDCEGFSDRPVFPDIGVLVSNDPVAVDQASADLMNRSRAVEGTMADRPEIESASDKLLAMFGIEWWRQLERAEELGVGSREYTLERAG